MNQAHNYKAISAWPRELKYQNEYQIFKIFLKENLMLNEKHF